jgi:hypothetical protein
VDEGMKRHELQIVVVILCVAVAMASARADQGPSFPLHVLDVLPLTSDHIVISLWRGAVAKTLDGGATWTEVSTPALQHLALGDGGRVWGLHGWQGIHEPSSGSLALSTDGGSTFQFHALKLSAAEQPPEAFIHAPGSRPVLLTGSGQLWRHRGGGPGWANWERVGRVPTSNEITTGFTAGSSIYVADQHTVWLSRDNGRNWQHHDLPGISSFSHDGATCWAAQYRGNLYRAHCGTQDWVRFARVEALETVYGIATIKARTFIAGRTATSEAFSACVSATRRIHVLKTDQAGATANVRRAGDGSLWLFGDGLFRMVRGHWRSVWPPRDAAQQGRIM